MKLTKLLIFCFSAILLSFSASSQTGISVNGIVVDDLGLPLPGVTVSIKGTTNATSTGIDGQYQISTFSDATLVFSYIGFNNVEEVVAGRNSINVTMTPNTEDLNEVVVVGYGTQ